MSTPQTLPGAVKHQVIAGFTQAAARYDTGGTEFFTAMGTRLVEQAQIGPGARVLDVGCGKGAVTLPAARLAGGTLTRTLTFACTIGRKPARSAPTPLVVR